MKKEDYFTRETLDAMNATLASLRGNPAGTEFHVYFELNYIAYIGWLLQG